MSDGVAITAACHCGKATIKLPRRPDYINRCNCSLCAKSGFQGMYFASNELRIAGEFDSYVREDLAEPMIRQMRCANCGIATHWMPLTDPPHARIGVNARLLDPALIEGVELHDVDGASW